MCKIPQGTACPSVRPSEPTPSLGHIKCWLAGWINSCLSKWRVFDFLRTLEKSKRFLDSLQSHISSYLRRGGDHERARAGDPNSLRRTHGICHSIDVCDGTTTKLFLVIKMQVSFFFGILKPENYYKITW